MSLITETEKLRELDKSPARGLQYLAKLTTDAPAMLEVLGKTQRGDAEKLKAASDWLNTTNAHQCIKDAVDRATEAASLMEQEEREG